MADFFKVGLGYPYLYDVVLRHIASHPATLTGRDVRNDLAGWRAVGTLLMDGDWTYARALAFAHGDRVTDLADRIGEAVRFLMNEGWVRADSFEKLVITPAGQEHRRSMPWPR